MVCKYSNKNTTSNTMCIYIEPDLADPKRRFKNIGLSVVDFTTGKNGVYEVYNMKNTNDPCMVAFIIGFIISLILWNKYTKKLVYE